MGRGSRTAAASKMDLIATVLHGCLPVITIVTTSSILEFAVALDTALYVDIL